MAINSIGNLTYINQASSATSALQSSQIPQHTPINHALFSDAMQRMEEVRPTEETQKTLDREGNGKREFDEENSNDNKEKSSFQEEIEKGLHKKKRPDADRVLSEHDMLMKPENHILDIKG